MAGFGIGDIKHWYDKAVHAGKDAVNSIQHALTDALHKISGAADTAQHEISGVADTAVHSVQGEAIKAKHALDDVGNEIKRDIEAAGHKFHENASAAVSDAISSLAEAFTQKALQEARDLAATAHAKLEELEKNKPDLVDAINEVGFDIEIGPVGMSYSGFYTRAEEITGILDTFANEPPEFRRGPLLDFFRAVSPTSWDFSISVNFALVIGSDELGVGVSMSSVPSALGIELLDVLLEKLGIPE